MEKLLIITEKPSAFRNFETALGGREGTFEGDTFALVHLFGHILTHETPEKVAYPQHAGTVGPFSNIANLPWKHTYFDFDKKVAIPARRQEFNAILNNIRNYLNNGYIPVIASDIDAMGEGDLLVSEVLTHVGYRGKTYREYHEDETPKSILKSLRGKKDVTARNDGLVAGTTRMVLDFLTQQLVRAATVTIQEQGYRLPRPVPVGRLQSTILHLTGDQIVAVRDYKPSSVWESRYSLDDVLVLTNPDVAQYKTKEEWQPDSLPMESAVREVKAVPGRTAPPKALSLTGLSRIMSTKGISTKQTLALTQAMYDDAVLTYPRTEDNFISPEQFAEMLPQVDTILSLMGLTPAVFTHREPRKTHVKNGGSHGALRPGVNLPESIDLLDAKYGRGASAVYKTVTERFLMMFLEDTEWVRHDYETTETPVPFTGSIRIITKKGVTDPDEKTDDIAAKLPDVSHKAKLYAHEVKSSAPKKPTESWLLGQLEKHNVGTASTQGSTVSRMVGRDGNFPLIAGKKANEPLSLSPIGTVGYQVAKEISLGTPECTRQYEAKIKQVVKDEATQEEVFLAFTETMRKDIGIIKGLSFDLKGLGFPSATERAEGTWNGERVRIPAACNGHDFTKEELDALFSGGTVTFQGKDFNGNPQEMSVTLGYCSYKGKRYVGFHDANYCYGVWARNNAEIKFKRVYMGYRFTDEECRALLSGGKITFQGTTAAGESMQVSGGLEAQKTAGGVSFIGLKPEFPVREGYVKGVFKGREATIKGSWSDHTFTEAELDALFAGEAITIEYTSKKGRAKASGKLEWQTYQGRKFLGFKADFGKKK